jgi:hypothetical protein
MSVPTFPTWMVAIPVVVVIVIVIVRSEVAVIVDDLGRAADVVVRRVDPQQLRSGHEDERHPRPA